MRPNRLDRSFRKCSNGPGRTAPALVRSGSRWKAGPFRESRRARRLTVRVFHSGRVEVVVRLAHLATHGASAFSNVTARGSRRSARKREGTPCRREALSAGPDRAARRERMLALHVAGGAGRPALAKWRARAAEHRGDAQPSHAPSATRCAAGSRARAAETLAPQLEACAREMGLPYRRLAVRRQRTRWGSCSARGTISLNCCLLFQRPEVVRYLLVHELAHIRHMNHSARFWDAGRPALPGLPPTRSRIAGWLAACTIVGIPATSRGPADEHPPTTTRSERVDLSDETIHWDLGSSLSYGEYLQLDKDPGRAEAALVRSTTR